MNTFLLIILSLYTLATLRGVWLTVRVEYKLLRYIKFPYWTYFTPVVALLSFLGVTLTSWVHGALLHSDHHRSVLANHLAQNVCKSARSNNEPLPEGIGMTEIHKEARRILGMSDGV